MNDESEGDVFEYPDGMKIRYTIGPPRIWHPDKGFIPLDGLTDEDRRRIFDDKSPFVTLAENDDAS